MKLNPYAPLVIVFALSARAFALDTASGVVNAATHIVSNGGKLGGGTTTTGITASTTAAFEARKKAIIVGARYASPEYYHTAIFKDAKAAVAETLGKTESELGTDDQAAEIIKSVAELLQEQE